MLTRFQYQMMYWVV